MNQIPKTNQCLRMAPSDLGPIDCQRDSKTNCPSPLYLQALLRPQRQQSSGYSFMFLILSGLDPTHSALRVNTTTNQPTTQTTLSPMMI